MNRETLKGLIAQTVPVVMRLADQAGVPFPPDLLADLEKIGIKTMEYYQKQIDRLTRSLYRGNVDELEFVFVMGDLITGQLTKAWYEGMAENGLTKDDMTDEWRAILDGIIAEEKSHLADLAAAIDQASIDKTPIDPLLTRAALWGGRYEDVVNQAKLATAEPKDKFEWVYGDTEHCETCAALNGLVARAGEWEQSGFHPQMPPNGLLECGGWRCQCRLEPTDKRRTANVLQRLLDLAASQNV
jgi:hypothetical protein